MIATELLDLLVCPETKASLSLADDATLDKINAAINAGTVKDREGEVVEDAIDGALLREDQAYCYLIRDDIPVMLMDKAISFDAFKLSQA
jgi:uncharacterized protein YbaR (Trm112 family)